mmetsp:Transcript_33531/g.105004  ORF Transcript_33531/g.105004 Transcript_33531/m.105004 type:complete len:222 (+) Transcript_33531:790-1455(+)
MAWAASGSDSSTAARNCSVGEHRARIARQSTSSKSTPSSTACSPPSRRAMMLPWSLSTARSRAVRSCEFICVGSALPSSSSRQRSSSPLEAASISAVSPSNASTAPGSARARSRTRTIPADERDADRAAARRGVSPSRFALLTSALASTISSAICLPASLNADEQDSPGPMAHRCSMVLPSTSKPVTMSSSAPSSPSCCSLSRPARTKAKSCRSTASSTAA